ncbi:MAG: hypothetical protein FLDDKLPJ_03331 [Phycisphaerae bacterium]|nr:hypothetical protein [Phycisphaerae bacterium]
MKRTCKHRTLVYYPALVDDLPAFAMEIGYSLSGLRNATQTAIRNRIDDAYISHESDRGRGQRPDILSLDIGQARVHFTIEAHVVMVRGYSYDIDREPLDNRDGGYFYVDNAWPF